MHHDDHSRPFKKSSLVCRMHENFYHKDREWRSKGLGQINETEWKKVDDVDGLFKVLSINPIKDKPIKELGKKGINFGKCNNPMPRR